MERQQGGPAEKGSFESTDWGRIELARGEDSPQSRQALADLCAAYWYPIYAYIRRRGHTPDQSQDLTQGLFATLLGRDFLSTIGPEKGKFRSYLLAACQHYLSNERDRSRVVRRGGHSVTISIDLPDAEGRYACEPSHTLTAEKLFERRWALTLLGLALRRLDAEMARADKAALFDSLRPALLGDGRGAPYAQVAEELSMTESAVKMAAFRLRSRFRQLIWEEVSRTVDTGGDAGDEIRDLFVALGP